MYSLNTNRIVASVETHSKSERICIEDEHGILTYHDLYQFAVENADRIISLPVKEKHIGILLNNSISYVKWFFTCMYANAVVIPINTKATEFEITNFIKACDIQLIITNEEYAQKINSDHIQNRIALFLEDCMEYIVYQEGQAYADCTENGFIELITTSGSSNQPKCVMLSTDNLVSNAMDIIESLQYTQNEVILVLLPFCFASANTSQLIVALLLGAKLILFHKPILPMNIINAINQYQVTSTTIVPSILHVLVNTNAIRNSRDKLSSLRTICFGGGKSCDSDMEKAYELFDNVNLTQMYGQTEASTRISHLHRWEAKEKKGSVGKPLKHISVKIVDEQMRTLSANQEGEIVVSGPNVMKGYYKNQELTMKTIVDDWLMTGDIGLLDEDGYLYIKGRKKNIIIHSGINIYPEEIENILMMLEGVQEAFVYGEENEIYGEVVIANLVRKQGEKEITVIDVMDYCFAHLPKYKVPYKINFVESLPKTGNGKLCRKGVTHERR